MIGLDSPGPRRLAPMRLSPNIIVFLLFETVLLVTPMIFPTIPLAWGIAIYAVAALGFIVGGLLLLKDHFFSTALARPNLGFTRRLFPHPTNESELFRYVNTSSLARECDEIIARDHNTTVPNHNFSSDMLLDMCVQFDVNNIQQLNHLLR